MISETMRFFSVQIALLAIVLILHTYIGLHIIRRTLIFSDLVLDQLAAFGALVGVGLGIAYGSAQSYLFPLGAVLVGAMLLACIKPRKTIPREAVIGIMYASVLVASLLLGDKLCGGEAYVTKTLSGSMLWVTWPLVLVTLVTYLILIVFHYMFRHRFIALVESSETTPGDKWWDFLFFASQGIITVLIVPTAGVLLAYAFLMIPAAMATVITRNWRLAVLIGWSLGFLACVAGVCLSYFINLPYGPTLVLCLGACFIGTVLIRCFISRPE